MKKHINFISKTAFLEIQRISTIHHYLTDDAKKTLVVSHVLSHIDYCNSLLACLPQSLVGKLQRVQNCAAHLVVCALHMFMSLQYSDIHTSCPSELKFPSPSLPLLISVTFYICTCLFDLFAPVQTPASSKFHFISAR